MNLGKKEGIVVVGEIQKREIMPLTLESVSYTHLPRNRLWDMNLLKVEVSGNKFFIRAYNIALLPYYSERRVLPFTCCFVKSSHIKHK